jgi:hypothetical protein
MPDCVDAAVEDLHLMSSPAERHVYYLRDNGIVIDHEDLLSHRCAALRFALSLVVKLDLRLGYQFMDDEEEQRAKTIEKQDWQQPQALVTSEYPLVGQSAQRERHHSPVDETENDYSEDCLA